MSPLPKEQELLLFQSEPAVLLGMHRSGTSLVTRLLIDIGMHMGRRLSKNSESLFFQELNRQIFSDAGAKWSRVEPVLEAMHSKEFVEQQHTNMQTALGQGRGVASFFGRRNWKMFLDGEKVSWGWKDPRTTITFPIWVRIFPQARFVHVIRNGIDVAISIHRRAQDWQGKWRKRFSRDYSPATLEFEHGFYLWEAYVSFALEYKQLIPPEQYLEMRYEDLLREPHEQLRQLVDFFGYAVSDDMLLAASAQVDQGRLDNSTYAANYWPKIQLLASSPLMQRLGYSYSLTDHFV